MPPASTGPTPIAPAHPKGKPSRIGDFFSSLLGLAPRLMLGGVSSSNLEEGVPPPTRARALEGMTDARTPYLAVYEVKCPRAVPAPHRGQH
jgi:hypothetical protein